MIDTDAILSPIPGDNPAGQDLKYDPVYDQIKEARRADDTLNRGDWNRELKTSDWKEVIKIAGDALTGKTKDLQIGAWLTEALINTQGFEGLATGFKILTGFLSQYWDHVYPLAEDGDMEFRAGPFEFMNDKLWTSIKNIPITDKKSTPGYTWLKWQESRQVGYEKDILNQFGDVDENKRVARNEKIAEGKLSAEEFDIAVAGSSKAFYEKIMKELTACLDEFKAMDEAVDQKFGKDAPRLSELKGTLEECEQVIARILKDKKQQEPDIEGESAALNPDTDAASGQAGYSIEDEYAKMASSAGGPSAGGGMPLTSQMTDQVGVEQTLWNDALATLKQTGIKEALEKLRNASYSSPSIRQKNRYRLMIAKLSLIAGRPDLARPLIEELYALITELNLERWESPLWIGEVIDAYYRCLTVQGATEEDINKAKNELFQKLCTKDITKAINYKR